MYVGQSMILEGRIADHRDPRFRQRNPSLHYAIWEYYMAHYPEHTKDKFVYLYDTSASLELGITDKSLNILKIWCSLILQTLRRRTLERFLPIAMLRSTASTHLNVAPPLIQCRGDASKKLLEKIYRDADPLT
jgi:hypothetical protein